MKGVDDGTQAALLTAVAAGQAARGAKGPIERALGELDQRTIDGVLDKLDRNEGLTGDEALMAWHQLAANRRLRRHLEREVRAGVVAAVGVKSDMEGGNADQTE